MRNLAFLCLGLVLGCSAQSQTLVDSQAPVKDKQGVGHANSVAIFLYDLHSEGMASPLVPLASGTIIGHSLYTARHTVRDVISSLQDNDLCLVFNQAPQRYYCVTEDAINFHSHVAQRQGKTERYYYVVYDNTVTRNNHTKIFSERVTLSDVGDVRVVDPMENHAGPQNNVSDEQSYAYGESYDGARIDFARDWSDVLEESGLKKLEPLDLADSPPGAGAWINGSRDTSTYSTTIDSGRTKPLSATVQQPVTIEHYSSSMLEQFQIFSLKQTFDDLLNEDVSEATQDAFSAFTQDEANLLPIDGGDSGGGLLIIENGMWKLAGIVSGFPCLPTSADQDAVPNLNLYKKKWNALKVYRPTTYAYIQNKLEGQKDAQGKLDANTVVCMNQYTRADKNSDLGKWFLTIETISHDLPALSE